VVDILVIKKDAMKEDRKQVVNLVTGEITYTGGSDFFKKFYASEVRENLCKGDWFEQVPEGEKTAKDVYDALYAIWMVEIEKWRAEQEKTPSYIAARKEREEEKARENKNKITLEK
jgi:hypothetical protein